MDRGLYIAKYSLPPLGGEYPREKAKNVEEKGRKGKENEKRGSKRVK
jgi:hypothetical protein